MPHPHLPRCPLVRPPRSAARSLTRGGKWRQDEIKALKKDKAEQEKRQAEAKSRLERLKKDREFLKNRDKSRQAELEKLRSVTAE